MFSLSRSIKDFQSLPTISPPVKLTKSMSLILLIGRSAASTACRLELVVLFQQKMLPDCNVALLLRFLAEQPYQQ